jgi:UDP-N-acetylglucosamine 2-epimerase (non-hydrolysing)
MLTDLENSFGIEPNFSLSVQSKNFTNSNLIAKLINELSNVIHQENIQKIIAQGDTFTVLCSSLVAFMEQRKFYHIEAGLRTSNIKLPFPKSTTEELFLLVVILILALLRFLPLIYLKKISTQKVLYK